MMSEEVVTDEEQLQETEEQESRDKQMLIEGFLLIYSVPSVTLLERTFPLEFKDTVVGKRVTNLVRGYFRNKVTTLRKKWYKLLDDTTIRIGEQGRMQQMRILTFDKVPEFTKKKDALIEEWKEYDHELERFLLYGEVPKKNDNNPRREYNLDYLKEIKEYLRDVMGINPNEMHEFIRPPKFHQHLYLNYIEMSFNTQIFENYLEEKGQKAVDEVDREKLRLLEQVKQEVEIQRHAQINQALDDVNERVNEIMKRLSKIIEGELTMRSMNRVKTEMDKVVDLASSANLYQKVAKRLDAIENLKFAYESENPALLRNAVREATPFFSKLDRFETLRIRMLSSEKEAAEEMEDEE